MKDRITLAWELRRDIHALIKSNPHCVMAEIFAAFAHRKRETVRKAVIRMRNDGDIALVGKNRKHGNEGIYAAATTQIKPESNKRKSLADGARKSQPLAAAACRKNPAAGEGLEPVCPVDPTVQKWIGGSFKNTHYERPVTVCPDAMKGVGYRGMTQLEGMA